MKKVNILNVAIDNLCTKELLKSLAREGGVVVTPNTGFLTN